MSCVETALIAQILGERNSRSNSPCVSNNFSSAVLS